MFWRGASSGGVCSVLEGCNILEGVAFWEGVWHFGRVWHFARVLAMFWRGVAFLEGASSVLEGCGFFGGCLQYSGGVWHRWRALAVLWRGVTFFRRLL